MSSGTDTDATGTGDGPGATSTSGASDASTAPPASSADVPTTDTTASATSDPPTTEGASTGQIPDTHGEPDTMTSSSGDPVEPRPCEGEPAPLAAEVISYLESQAVQPPDTDGTTGEGGDPDLVHVRFSDVAFTCEDPHDELACGHHWELSLRIPAAFQAPGLYALSGVDALHGFGLSNGDDLGGGDCDFVGAMAEGTLEILAIDDGQITGRLCHVTWPGFDDPFVLVGSFVAPRCPQ